MNDSIRLFDNYCLFGATPPQPSLVFRVPHGHMVHFKVCTIIAMRRWGLECEVDVLCRSS